MIIFKVEKKRFFILTTFKKMKYTYIETNDNKQKNYILTSLYFLVNIETATLKYKMNDISQSRKDRAFYFNQFQENAVLILRQMTIRRKLYLNFIVFSRK